jgi:hypothetical protein
MMIRPLTPLRAFDDGNGTSPPNARVVIRRERGRRDFRLVILDALLQGRTGLVNRRRWWKGDSPLSVLQGARRED